MLTRPSRCEMLVKDHRPRVLISEDDIDARVQALADEIADDMSDFIWRHREAFAGETYPGPDEAARKVVAAVSAGEVPVAVGDYSDRPGDATHILRAFEAAGIGRALYATIADEPLLRQLMENGASAGDSFDRPIGGLTASGGDPVRIRGTLVYLGEGFGYQRIAAVEFGDDNLVIITPAYEQVRTPETLRFGPIDPDRYDVFVVKSRVHFRRGFYETGYAKTILVVEDNEHMAYMLRFILERAGYEARCAASAPEALELLQRAVELAPGDGTAWVALARVLQDFGRVDLAQHAGHPQDLRGDPGAPLELTALGIQGGHLGVAGAYRHQPLAHPGAAGQGQLQIRLPKVAPGFQLQRRHPAFAVVAAYYYLRVIVFMYMRESEVEEIPLPVTPAMATVNGRDLIFYCGGNGIVYAFEPLTGMPPDGEGATFNTLVRSAIHSRGLTARAVLKRLEDLGIVEHDAVDGTVMLKQEDNVFISKNDLGLLDVGFTAIANLASAASFAYVMPRRDMSSTSVHEWCHMVPGRRSTRPSTSIRSCASVAVCALI